ncbi:MAG: ferritin-like domain-containing protein [Candidatus Micrarchaeia archaeon]
MTTMEKVLGKKKMDEILRLLDSAIADEWLAFMQYKFAAVVVRGKGSKFAADVFEEIAKEELEHIDELGRRMIELGSTTSVINPKRLMEKTNCGFSEPSRNPQKSIKDAISSESCAIKTYMKIAGAVKDSDPTTYNLILHIMSEEEQHESKFEAILESI